MEQCEKIKDSKRSNLSSNSLEKRAILFITAHLEEACLLCNDNSNHRDIFGDDVIRYGHECC